MRATAVVADALRADPRLGASRQLDAFSLMDGGEGAKIKSDGSKNAIGYQRTIEFTPPPGLLVEQWTEVLIANLNAQGFHVTRRDAPRADPPAVGVHAKGSDAEVSFHAFVSSLRLRVDIVSLRPGWS